MSFISAGNTTTTTLIMNGDTTGNLVFNTGGANTTALTISNTQNATFAGTVTATGGVLVGASAAPAFSAYQSSGQSLGAGATTVITFDGKEFDTNTNYSTSTYRFTPTVAGYYLIIGCVNAAYGAGETSTQLFKNGSFFKILADTQNQSLYVVAGSALVYMNGTTDYVDIRSYVASATTTSVGSNRTYFQGFLARSA